MQKELSFNVCRDNKNYCEQLNTILLNDEQVQIPYLNWFSLSLYFVLYLSG